jgi:hypothetical protein
VLFAVSYGDTASDRLGATGDRGCELRVRDPDLVGFHLNGAAVPKRRLRRDRAVLTGEQMSAIDLYGATIRVRGWRDDRQRRVKDVVRIQDCAISETHGLRPRQANCAAREDAPAPHVERTIPHRDEGCRETTLGRRTDCDTLNRDVFRKPFMLGIGVFPQAEETTLNLGKSYLMSRGLPGRFSFDGNSLLIYNSTA